MSNNKNAKNVKVIAIAISVLVVLAILFVLFGPKVGGLFNGGFGQGAANINVVADNNELKEKLDIDVKEPEDAQGIVYGIENDSIAVVRYKKKISSGQEMNFTMRSSYSTEDIDNSIGLLQKDGKEVDFAYTPIMMTVICDDETEVPVESKVALDSENEDMRFMKALWFDNDKYYSMVTDNLVTREDFLQEVNRVIIANHIPF